MRRRIATSAILATLLLAVGGLASALNGLLESSSELDAARHRNRAQVARQEALRSQVRDLSARLTEAEECERRMELLVASLGQAQIDRIPRLSMADSGELARAGESFGSDGRRGVDPGFVETARADSARAREAGRR